MRRTATLAANDLSLLRRDPTAPIILVLMPVILIAFFRPAWEPVLEGQGYGFANGAEQAVPGTAVMFAFFMVAFVGVAFYREYIWGTWDRLRAFPIPQHQILIAKVVPAFAIICVQQLLLFVAGTLLFGLDVRGSVAALVAVDLAFCVFLLAFVLAAVAYCTTYQQVLAVSNLSAMVFAGLGGALTPIETLPGWAEAIGPATPAYWAMEGFNRVLLDGDGLADVLAPVAVLLGLAVALFVLAAVRFRFDEAKGGTL